MAETFIENTKLPKLKEEYQVEKLKEKFAAQMEALRKQGNKDIEYQRSLQELRDEVEEEQRVLRKINSEQGNVAYEYKQIDGLMSMQEIQHDLSVVQKDIEKGLSQSAEIRKEQSLLRQYGKEFAQLYQIKEDNFKRGYKGKITFTEVDVTDNGDILRNDQYYEMNADPEGKVIQLALKVELEDVNFNIGMMGWDKPNSDPQIKMQLSMPDEQIEDLSIEQLKNIFAFCENHGLSIEDMEIRSFDGTLNMVAIQEKIGKMLELIKQEKAQQIQQKDNEEYREQQARYKDLRNEYDDLVKEGKAPQDDLSGEEISTDGPQADGIFIARSAADNQAVVDNYIAVQKNKLSQQQSLSNPSSTGNTQQSTAVPTGNKNSKITRKQVEKEFEEWIGTASGLGKIKGQSYFKTHTQWFGRGWTEYIVYDSNDPDNRKKDGVEDKNGNVKYSYSFKLFINQDSDGRLHFSYRTPNHKRIDESIVNGIVGRLEGLGFTHINFPEGIPDSEKGMWRKALAEKGLVPIGISLDRSKAEGMMKAAKEKLSSEKYTEFKFRLALQMKENFDKKIAKGKKIDSSEMEFVQSLLLGHRYEIFATAYGEKLKSKLTEAIHPKHENENSAIDKVAALRNLRRVFNAFKDGVDSGSILTSDMLKPEEKAKIQRAGLTGNPSDFTCDQIAALYDIMLPQSKEEAKNMLLEKFAEQGAKRPDETIKKGVFNSVYNNCKNISKELKALGVDEIDLPETTDSLPFVRPQQTQQHHNTQTQQQTNTQPAPQRQGNNTYVSPQSIAVRNSGRGVE